MKKAIKMTLRGIYLLPVMGLVFGTSVIKHKGSTDSHTHFGIEKAHADVPGGGDGTPVGGDCPTGADGDGDGDGDC